jgi:hypothetical protein
MTITDPNDATFGDFELADAWDDEPLIAPEQLARRLHSLILQIDAFGGQDTPNWDDLDDDTQDLAIAIATELVAWIMEREPDNPALTAKRIHDVRVFLSGGVVRKWDELTPSEQQVAIDLVTLIINWLERQGPR